MGGNCEKKIMCTIASDEKELSIYPLQAFDLLCAFGRSLTV